MTTTIEKSAQLFRIIEDECLFNPILRVNYESGMFLSVEYMDDMEDGTFPRVSDWTRLVNRIDKYGVSEYLTWASRDKNKLIIDLGHCKIIRDSKTSDSGTIIFEKPIQVIVATLNNEPVTISANQIEGSFTFEWLWSKKGRQDITANAIEIYFNCKNFIIK